MFHRIFLTGYRAVGKSSVAGALARRLHWKSFDTDPLIEAEAGKTIAKIFEEDGEPDFRDREAAALRLVLRETDNLVLATGGGLPLREESRRLMKESGIVFWLTASVETIAKRMKLDVTTNDRRPSLTGRSPVQEIEDVLKSRTPVYQEGAHFVIDTDNKTLEEVVNEILLLYQNCSAKQ